MNYYPFSNQICRRPNVVDGQFRPELASLLDEQNNTIRQLLGIESVGLVAPTYDASHVAAVWIGNKGNFDHPVLLFHGTLESFKADEPLWAVGRVQPATVESIEHSHYPANVRAERYMRYALSKQFQLASCLVWLCHMHTRADVKDTSTDVPEATLKQKY